MCWLPLKICSDQSINKCEIIDTENDTWSPPSCFVTGACTNSFCVFCLFLYLVRFELAGKVNLLKIHVFSLIGNQNEMKEVVMHYSGWTITEKTIMGQSLCIFGDWGRVGSKMKRRIIACANYVEKCGN